MGQIANRMVLELLMRLSEKGRKKKEQKEDREQTERDTKHESSKRNSV